LFVPTPLSEGAAVEASTAQAHYLGTVMRRSAGDPVRLFNGADGEWEARIVPRGRGRLTLVPERQVRPQAPEPDLWLLFAPLKRDTTDLVVEKATELGVSALLPVSTERTNAGRVNADRLNAVAIEAAEQCERLTVPRIAPLRPLADVLADWPPGRPLFAGLERDAAATPPPAAPRHAALLIGPEGGFGPRDRALLSRLEAVVPVSLGPRILRAETAAIVGLALLQRPSCG
jgi:16S rRNA (uracil1498-N3)-methyltransferase